PRKWMEGLTLERTIRHALAWDRYGSDSRAHAREHARLEAPGPAGRAAARTGGSAAMGVERRGDGSRGSGRAPRLVRPASPAGCACARAREGAAGSGGADLPVPRLRDS